MRRTLRMLALLAAVSCAVAAAGPAASVPRALPALAFAPERVFSPGFDEWEPAVAADSAGHVYVMTTRYGARPSCPNHCPSPILVYRRSSDGGRTFGPALRLCVCKGWDAQYDPVMAVDDAGRVYAAWLNEFNVSFARSDDFGRTWTRYRLVDGSLRWSDKPWIGVSPSGDDVLVTFNGNPVGRPYAVVSHDRGRTWSPPVALATGGRYWFATGATVMPDGTMVTSQLADIQDYRGDIRLFVARSVDGGATWRRTLVGVSAAPPRCPRGFGCGFGFLGAQVVAAADGAGAVYALFTRNERDRGPARLWFRWSTDGGVTFSRARLLAAAPGVDHEFPMIAATGDGDVRVGWMDDRTGHWNTWFRRSTDGGLHWARETRLSDVTGARPYKHADGFEFPYGDYGQLAVDGSGRTWAAWGEGTSWTGPGSTWFTHSR